MFFNGERIARKDFPSNAISYYFSDHLKTTDIVTDSQGNIKNESDFYPWGGELQFLANDSNHYKFTLGFSPRWSKSSLGNPTTGAEAREILNALCGSKEPPFHP